jgi:hypothetical protein
MSAEALSRSLMIPTSYLEVLSVGQNSQSFPGEKNPKPRTRISLELVVISRRFTRVIVRLTFAGSTLLLSLRQKFMTNSYLLTFAGEHATSGCARSCCCLSL